ncbi:hypothetical protein TruAng_009871 [Truncatella angustata]|nr:hypothetical protein TruAng_009871 [Truncatella angustata]
MKTVTVSNSHGYKPVGHHAGVGKNRDGWEALKVLHLILDVYRHTYTDPSLQLGRSELRGRWALPSVVRENLSHFSDFQDACHFVTKLLLDCISSKLELRGNYSLQQYHRDDAPSKSSLFFNHYPTLDTAKEEVGQNQHTDLGSLTLLFAPQWGLQVLSPVDFLCLETGEQMQWQSVEPRAGHAIVNVGDTLRFLSNYRLRSALHRALPLESCDRYSIAYFLRPSDDSEFQDSMGKTTTAVNWYLQKNETYESHEKQDELILLGGIKESIHKAPIYFDEEMLEKQPKLKAEAESDYEERVFRHFEAIHYESAAKTIAQGSDVFGYDSQNAKERSWVCRVCVKQIRPQPSSTKSQGVQSAMEYVFVVYEI